MTREQAVALYEARFWEEMTAAERFTFQLYESRLCMPFEVLQQAAAETLGRPVFTHEFAFSADLKAELLGNKPAPTFEEILDLIPAEKRIVLHMDELREPWEGAE